MAFTRLGVCGPSAAYPGFSAKEAAAAVIGDIVTAAGAAYARTVTLAEATFGRVITTEPAVFARTLTTSDGER